MNFELVNAITDVQVIAAGPGIRELPRLHRFYGRGRWRKLKGVAVVRLPNGVSRRVEIHWYEAHGIGRKEMKIKRYLNL